MTAQDRPTDADPDLSLLTPEELGAAEAWNNRREALKQALEPVLDLIDSAPDQLQGSDLAELALDAVFHRLTVRGMTKHQTAAMLRRVARGL